MQPTELIRTLYDDVLSAHRLDRLPELAGPEVAAAIGGPLAALLAGFPDLRYTITDLVADGDRVAVRWTWTGTHSGRFRTHAPTHRTVTNGGLAIYTVRDGRLASVVLETDRLGFLEQIGAAGRAIAPQQAAIYLVDTFRVPAAARAELAAATRRNRDFIRTLPGFRGDAVLVRAQGDAFDLATIAAWESEDAIARAKEAVADHYRRIGFDPAASLARWGATLERTICTAPPELP